MRKNQSYYLFDGYYSPDLSTLISKQFEEHSVLESSYYKFPHPLHRSKPDHSRTFLRERKDSKSVMCTVKFIERYVPIVAFDRQFSFFLPPFPRRVCNNNCTLLKRKIRFHSRRSNPPHSLPISCSPLFVSPSLPHSKSSISHSGTNSYLEIIKTHFHDIMALFTVPYL